MLPLILLLLQGASAHILPIVFEPNQGQTVSGIAYLSNTSQYQVAVQPAALILTPPNAPPLQLRFANANPNARIEPLEPTSGVSNYYRLPKPLLGVPHYRSLQVRDIYPGIAIRYHSREGNTEFDFLLDPGAEPRIIHIALDPDADARLHPTGDLVFVGSGLRLRKPVSYQTINGQRIEIPSAFQLNGNIVSFSVAAYDPTISLTIDPFIESSSRGPDYAGTFSPIGVTPNGTIIAATAVSRPPCSFTTNAPEIYGITPDWKTILFTTKLGSCSLTWFNRMLIDSRGDIILAGGTQLPDFDLPLVGPGGKADIMLLKIYGGSGAILMSQRFGGSEFDVTGDVVVDNLGNIYVSGATLSTDFPLKDPLQARSGGGQDAFLTKLNAQGSILFSTYFGGPNWESANAVAVDAKGAVYFGGAGERQLPIKNAFQPVLPEPYGNRPAFLAKVAPDGRELIYSTYLGGNNDSVLGLAPAPDGALFVTGHTTTESFPTKPPILKSFVDRDVFLLRMREDGKDIDWSTLIGVNDRANQEFRVMALDSNQNVALALYPATNTLPTLDPFQTSGRIYLAIFRGITGTPVFRSYIGSNNNTITVSNLSVGPTSLQIMGRTCAPDFPYSPTTSSTACGTYKLRLDGINVQCNYAVTSPPELPYTASEAQIALSTSSTCAWSLPPPSVAWIRYLSPTSGAGNATIRIQVAENESASSRETSITIGSQRILIRQAGRPTNPILRSAVNAADFTSALSPGVMAVLTGLNLTPSESLTLLLEQDVNTFPLTFTETAPDQLSLQLPVGLQPGNATFRLSSPGTPVSALSIQLNAASPRFFTVNAKGTGQVAFNRDDGTSVEQLYPARPEELLTAYFTGFGGNPEMPASLTIGSISAPIQNIAPSSEFPGLYLLTFTVPKSVPEGTSPVRLQIGDDVSPPTATTFASRAPYFGDGPPSGSCATGPEDPGPFPATLPAIAAWVFSSFTNGDTIRWEWLHLLSGTVRVFSVAPRTSSGLSCYTIFLNLRGTPNAQLTGPWRVSFLVNDRVRFSNTVTVTP